MSINQQISDYIYFYPDAMDTKTCNEIIKHYEKNAEWEESTFANEYGHTWGNKSVSMHQFWIGQPLPYFNELRDTFKYCTDDYMSVFERIGSVQSTDFRMNRYTKGGFMREHVDNIHYSHGQKLGYPHLTTLIFLNDDFEGGEFVLCGDKHIEKIQGSAVVFPSNFMYPHEVKEVTEGKRYSVMTWVM